MSFINKFVDWAHECLLQNEEAQAYLLGRGVSKDQWDIYNLGFVGGEYDVDSSLDPEHSGVCSNRETRHLCCDSCHYKSWSSTWEHTSEDGEGPKIQFIGRNIVGSIVFPLTSYSGTLVGFQVRSIVKKDYDTFTVRRRPEGYFFGTSAAINSIWTTKEVTLVEGATDCLVFARLVAPNILGLTTNAVSKMHLRFLRRFVRKVNLCMDLDGAGRKGVKDFIREYSNEFDDVRDIKYSKVRISDKDVNDVWKSSGDVLFSQQFRKLMR